MSAEPVRLAVLGDPLTYTRSPDLHRAGLQAAGLRGESHALRTPAASLGERLAELAARGFRGVNLTMPLKEAALEHVASASDAARRVRSINTLTLLEEGYRGDTTDGPGFLDLLVTLRRDTERERCVMLGAGGAARSLVGALLERGASVVVSARRPAAADPAWGSLGGAERVVSGGPAESEALAAATLVVNATPASDDRLPLQSIARGALLVDLRYGPQLTPWVVSARAAAREAYDGLGLLVFQARRSLSLWLDRDVPVAPLAAAVGWPR